MNRAQGCFRVLLWLMPTALVASSLFLGFGSSVAGRILGSLSGLLGLALLIAAAWFNATLSARVRRAPEGKRAGKIAVSMIVFIVIQIILVPVAIYGAIFAYCSLMPKI